MRRTERCVAYSALAVALIALAGQNAGLRLASVAAASPASPAPTSPDAAKIATCDVYSLVQVMIGSDAYKPAQMIEQERIKSRLGPMEDELRTVDLANSKLREELTGADSKDPAVQEKLKRYNAGAQEFEAKLQPYNKLKSELAEAYSAFVVAEEMARALGASAFVKPAPESYELLSSGVADGTFFPLESVSSFKLGSVVKYATLFPGGFYGSSFGMFMNEDKFNKLSKEDQDAIMSVSGENIARIAGKAWDDADKLSLEQMKKDGVQISEASPELVKAVQEKSKAIVDKWIEAAKAKGIDGAKVLAEFHEELKNVAAGK